MGDVAIYHRLCFVRHDKWAHIPAPIAVKKHVSREYLLQFAARRGFADTHRAAYDYKVFHKLDYLMDNDPRPRFIDAAILSRLRERVAKNANPPRSK
jgi:hypothetical protein